MRRIINSTYVSLDGVIADPQLWSLDYWNDECGEFAFNQLFASDALLMGRRTYEGFAAAWPERGGDEFADRINSMPKYVVSTTLESADWQNSTVIREDVVESVRKLKDQPGEDILMYGYGPLAHTLLRHGLLDEIRFWISPVLVGRSKEEDLVFRDGTMNRLALVDTKVIETGVVIHSYRPAPTAGE